MARDVVSHVSLLTKPKEIDSLEILLVATDGVRTLKIYRDLDVVKADFPDVGEKPSKIYRKVSQLFNQGKTSMAPGLFRKVKIVGIAAPETPAALVDAIESIRQNDDDWSVLLTDRDDPEYVKALQAYAESTEPTLAELLTGIEDHRKFYFFQTNDKTFEFKRSRSVAVYVNSLEEEGDAAYLGNVGPFYPVRKTWKFKKPDGVAVGDLTEGEKEALDEQSVNYMTKEYKRIYMKQGVCTDGEFIDVQFGADFIAQHIRERVYDILTTNDDVPYNDNGFALVGSGVSDALETSVLNHIVDKDPASGIGIFVVHLPLFANTTDAQKTTRVIPDIFWEAQIQGSVHSVTVRGVLTVSLSKTAA